MSEELQHESTPNLAGSMRRAAEAVFRTSSNRAELLGVEIEEEWRWIISALIRISAAIFLAVLAITMVTVSIVMLCPDQARPWLLVVLSGIYVLLAASAIAGVRKHFKSKEPPLSGTVGELKKDLEWIRSQE